MEFEACATTSKEAEAVPSDIFIMLDQSISMGEWNVPESDPEAPTRWEALTAALTNFIQSPASEGLRVGIQYFGLPVSGGGEVSCDPSDYATPDVALGFLPDNEDALLDSIAAHYPSNLTPSAPALEGALMYAKEWAIDNPERPVVVVFATDGYPTDCDSSIEAMEDLAESYANPDDDSPRISTFVLGVGPVPNLKRVARAAGTSDAYFVQNCETAVDDLQAALERLARSPELCEFEVPEPPEGELLDPELVNMVFTPPGGMSSEVIRHVVNSTACGAGGWYYDDNDSPEQVFVCPETCSRFGGGVVDLVLGCQTLSVQ